MVNQKKRQEQYDVELPQSIIDSFARFLVPEIQKFYASEQGQKELTTWENNFFDRSKEWCKKFKIVDKGLSYFGTALYLYCKAEAYKSQESYFGIRIPK